MDPIKVVYAMTWAIFEDLRDDPEGAHSHIDALMTDVLTAIANGVVDPKGPAKATLEVHNLNTPRWYA